MTQSGTLIDRPGPDLDNLGDVHEDDRRVVLESAYVAAAAAIAALGSIVGLVVTLTH